MNFKDKIASTRPMPMRINRCFRNKSLNKNTSC